MSNTATITITNIGTGITVAISSEDPTETNVALVAAVHMVSIFKQICEEPQEASNESRLDLN